MSFIQSTTGRGFSAGFFLADENCLRETMIIPANHTQAVTLADGSKIVPAGALITGKGLVYEDVEVTKGDMPGSVVTAGVVYTDRLPSGSSITGLTGITGKTAPTVTRPNWE
jgi:hypothetical protein